MSFKIMAEEAVILSSEKMKQNEFQWRWEIIIKDKQAGVLAVNIFSPVSAGETKKWQQILTEGTTLSFEGFIGNGLIVVDTIRSISKPARQTIMFAEESAA